MYFQADGREWRGLWERGESSRVIDGVVPSNSKARVATGFESESGYIGFPRVSAIGRTRLPCGVAGSGRERPGEGVLGKG